MSINKKRPHLYVLPEDRHDEQIANGFINNIWVNSGQVRVLPVAGGWLSVLEKFKTDYVPHLRKYPESNIVLLIDFDEEFSERLPRVKKDIPGDLEGRVFVVGVWDEPQDMKNACNYKSFEKIGEELADDCHANTTTNWNHAHLKHNDPERLRLLNAVKSILFGP